MKPTVEVVVRVKPARSESKLVTPVRSGSSYGQFEVDAVYGEDASQNDVFIGSVVPALDSFLQANHAEFPSDSPGWADPA